MIGYKWFVQSGFFWRWHHGALVPMSMPHVNPNDSPSGIQDLVITCKAPFARWEDKFDELDGGEWWHIIKDTQEDMDVLSANTRSKIRRGAKRFLAQLETRESIMRDGYVVYRSSFDRYTTFERMCSKEAFRLAINGLPQYTEFWGVRDRESGALVAFSENLVLNEACFYNSIWFQPEALKQYTGYVLFHEMNKHYLNERGLRYVSDGARNISHQTGVHDFLEQKFGFRRAYARLRVAYFPGFGLLVRCLFPFRRWFNDRKSSFAQKIAVVLEQERIRRSCSGERE